MKRDYKDIRSRIKTKPLWFDEFGVPRYCRFAPDKVANIYAREILFLLIACQSCGHEFKVAMTIDKAEMCSGIPLFSKNIQRIAYGDPPNIWCCHSGPSMSSVAKRVLGFWRKTTETIRVPELEVEIEDGFAGYG